MNIIQELHKNAFFLFKLDKNSGFWTWLAVKGRVVLYIKLGLKSIILGQTLGHSDHCIMCRGKEGKLLSTLFMVTSSRHLMRLFQGFSDRNININHFLWRARGKKNLENTRCRGNFSA